MTSDADDVIAKGREIGLSGKYAPTAPVALIDEQVPDEPTTQPGENPPSSNTEPDNAIDGARFILDQPGDVPAIWGSGGRVLWARGESLMIAGGQGLGKTTLAGQLTAGVLGIGDRGVLGLPIADLGCVVLYLAMDRPRQIARALRRQFSPADRTVLSERLLVWEGPPPRDLAANPALLAKMAAYYKAGVVIVDSLKDAAVRLSEDATWAYQCATEVINTRRLRGHPIPQALKDYHARIHATWEMSAHGPKSCQTGNESQTLGTEEAAMLLNCTPRHARRLARTNPTLGRIISGAWVFDRTAVEEYAMQKGIGI